MPDKAIRPTIFICYHKESKLENENELSKNKEHWRIQPFQATSCEASKCRAWVRDLELAVASSEAAVEKWSNSEKSNRRPTSYMDIE